MAPVDDRPISRGPVAGVTYDLGLMSTATAQMVRRARTRDLARPEPLVALLLFLLPISAIGMAQVGIAAVLSLTLLAPVVVVGAWRYRVFRWLFALTLLSVASVPVLHWYAARSPGRSVDGRLEFHQIMALLTALAIIAVILWAHGRGMATAWIAAWFAAGLLVQGLVDRSLWQGDPWKYALELPVSVLLLSTWAKSSRRRQTVVLLAIAALSASYDARSFAGFAVVTLLAVWAFKTPPATEPRRMRRFIAALLLLIVAYNLGIWGAQRGYLGEAIQERTVAETANGNSALLASRPEWHAALTLFRDSPLGIGPGIVPNADDVNNAISHLGPTARNSAYVTDYLFGSGVELHSTISDTWIHFGLFGLALTVLFAYLLVRSLIHVIARGQVTAVEVLLPVMTLWDLLFSPASALPRIALAVGLAVIALRPSEAA